MVFSLPHKFPVLSKLKGKILHSQTKETVCFMKPREKVQQGTTFATGNRQYTILKIKQGD